MTNEEADRLVNNLLHRAYAAIGDGPEAEAAIALKTLFPSNDAVRLWIADQLEELEGFSR